MIDFQGATITKDYDVTILEELNELLKIDYIDRVLQSNLPIGYNYKAGFRQVYVFAKALAAGNYNFVLLRTNRLGNQIVRLPNTMTISQFQAICETQNYIDLKRVGRPIKDEEGHIKHPDGWHLEVDKILKIEPATKIAYDGFYTLKGQDLGIEPTTARIVGMNGMPVNVLLVEPEKGLVADNLVLWNMGKPKEFIQYDKTCPVLKHFSVANEGYLYFIIDKSLYENIYLEDNDIVGNNKVDENKSAKEQEVVHKADSGQKIKTLDNDAIEALKRVAEGVKRGDEG